MGRLACSIIPDSRKLDADAIRTSVNRVVRYLLLVLYARFTTIVPSHSCGDRSTNVSDLTIYIPEVGSFQ